MKAIRGIEHDLILGMDFIEKFDVEMRPAKGVWTARGGDWVPLAHLRTTNDPVVKNIHEGPYETTAKLSSTGYLLEMEGSKREAEVQRRRVETLSTPCRVV